ncbi:hypothetical protein [Kitasatospora sp. NPDC093679]
MVRHLASDVGDWTHRLTDDIAVIALTRPAPEPAEPAVTAT